MNPITILLLGGVALLLINIIYGIVRARRGQVKAGWLTVSLALVACAMIGIGTVERTVNPAAAFGFPTGANRGNRPANFAGGANGNSNGAFQSGSDTSTQGLRNVSEQGNSGNFQQDGQAATGGGSAVDATPQTDPAATSQSPSADATPGRGSRRGNRGANGTGTGNGSSAYGNAGANGGGAGVGNGGTFGNAGANGSGTAAQGGANAASGTPDPAATPSGNRRFRQGQNGGANGATANAANATPAANDSAAATPASDAAGSGFNQQGAAGNGNGAANNAAAFDPNNLPLGVQIARYVPQIAVGGAVLGIILGWILYRMEKKRAGFVASSSRGLLNAGAGVFMLVAALVIPLIPAEIASASGGQPARAFARAAAVTRVAVTATPSPTPLPTATATPLPTLTPETTLMPIVMPTEIAYAAMQPTATATVVPDCTLTANNNLNLRADPSTNNASLGKAPIPTGTVLPVIGKSKDGKWWQVTYNDGMVDWTGWVSTTFTKAGSKCDAVPVTQ